MGPGGSPGLCPRCVFKARNVTPNRARIDDKRAPRRIAKREQPVNPLALGIATDFVVILGTGFAAFAHVAEHQHLATDGRGQHVDPGAYRIRVGVVGVVENFRALAPGPALQPSLDAGEGG